VTNELIYTLTGIFILCWLFQLLFQLRFILKTAIIKNEVQSNEQPPLSVIICAKNEAENLEKHLPHVLSQKYPKYQVIVVDDCSTDDTQMVLSKFKRDHPNFYFTSIPASKRFYQGKKLAVTIGIKASQYEHLVFTDADCQPTSENWLKELAGGFSSEKDIVIGHGRYQKTKGLLNRFVRYESFYNAVQYFGFTLSKKPYMAVGRNLAYKKSLFTDNEPFRRYLTLASGDDDLFITTCATSNNTSICHTYESQTESIPPHSFSRWIERKKRHLSTANEYPFNIKSWLFLEPFTRTLLWALTLFSVFFHIFVWYSIGLFFVRLILQYILLAKAAKKIGEGKIFLGTIFFDILIPVITTYVWIINIFSRKKPKWK